MHLQTKAQPPRLQAVFVARFSGTVALTVPAAAQQTGQSRTVTGDQYYVKRVLRQAYQFRTLKSSAANATPLVFQKENPDRGNENQ
jgi:hypothetical protein